MSFYETEPLKRLELQDNCNALFKRSNDDIIVIIRFRFFVEDLYAYNGKRPKIRAIVLRKAWSANGHVEETIKINETFKTDEEGIITSRLLEMTRAMLSDRYQHSVENAERIRNHEIHVPTEFWKGIGTTVVPHN